MSTMLSGFRNAAMIRRQNRTLMTNKARAEESHNATISAYALTARMRKNRSNTLLTGPGGVETPESVRKTTLLGG